MNTVKKEISGDVTAMDERYSSGFCDDNCIDSELNTSKIVNSSAPIYRFAGAVNHLRQREDLSLIIGYNLELTYFGQ